MSSDPKRQGFGSNSSINSVFLKQNSGSYWKKKSAIITRLHVTCLSCLKDQER